MRVSLSSPDLIKSFREWFSIYYSHSLSYCVYPLESTQTLPQNLDPYSCRIIALFKWVDETIIDVLGYRFEDQFDESPTVFIKILERMKDTIKVEPRDFSLVIDKEASFCFDELLARIDWIVEGGSEPEFNKNSYHVMYLLLHVGIKHKKFHLLQVEKERAWFLKHVYFVDDEHAWNEFGEGKMIKPTVEDLQQYHRDYSNEFFPPSFGWWEVDFETLPSCVVDKKLMYKGGKIHIHRKDLPHYFWRKIMVGLKPVSGDQFDTLLEFIATKYKKRFRQNAGGFLDIDIEDMPPCLQKIAFGTRFPLDWERTKFVACLAKGNVSLEKTEKILGDLNTKFPKDGGISLKKRWPGLELYYKKGYAPPKCEEMKLYCPFEGREDQRKMKCHQECFKQRHEKQYNPNQGTFFYGPADWFKFLTQKSEELKKE